MLNELPLIINRCWYVHVQQLTSRLQEEHRTRASSIQLLQRHLGELARSLGVDLDANNTPDLSQLEAADREDIIGLRCALQESLSDQQQLIQDLAASESDLRLIRAELEKSRPTPVKAQSLPLSYGSLHGPSRHGSHGSPVRLRVPFMCSVTDSIS